MTRRTEHRPTTVELRARAWRWADEVNRFGEDNPKERRRILLAMQRHLEVLIGDERTGSGPT